MSAPTPVVRAVVYERDQERCVSCGATKHLEFQHRSATGMGGSKIRPRYEEGVTSCVLCNGEYERSLQTLARIYGWKLKKVKRAVEHPEDVPVFYVTELTWFLVTTEGRRRVKVSAAWACERMREVYGPEWDGWVAAAGSEVFRGSIREVWA